MNALDKKVYKTIVTNKLNPKIIGERNWYIYFIRVTELIWIRNNYDGYLIEIYSDCSKTKHLTTIKI
ncbi:hypothetical protein B0A78_01820 [Flavobacterium columnare NBRC 100251 = ATCC 23463]|uniref:Uncharacterized protein n=1 Tax=Flavobacterium columnare TaxID=996 RepID=A0AAI8CI37_9FLAO|nr:hypothetical protein [Flavobacterium columnare]AMO20607.1 hypothetical protein UN65_09925 [Flavobacterium columnare]APT22182.1 hypothetical protein BU993_05760 [Flavobacterium columnare]AUX18579.1 hypothetical protein AQ623_10075 [Flavobacterium columnare]MBF6653964.1 hypothetical protein [Flavobacterium columnare]MBF6654901.1 hypothetical protein [Flavobacterium columnare]